MEQLEAKAYGKVNLGLDVTGLRDDGYHLVRMVMQTVDIYDVVTVSVNEICKDVCFKNSGSYKEAAEKCLSEKDRPCIRVSCSDARLPSDSSNLAYKAAEAICREFGVAADIEINIKKNIPVAAGMAGGSADAAAVLSALNILLDLGADDARLDSVAYGIGADVPFCLRRGTYLAEGIGEKLTKLKDIPHCSMIIVNPGFDVSTPWAYKELDRFFEENGGIDSVSHPDIDSLTDAISRQDIKKTALLMDNILERVVGRKYPEILKIKQDLLDKGALRALMSGSGPTVFGVFADDKEADAAFLNISGGEYGKFKVEF